MANYCNVTILGRLSRDPDLRQTRTNGTDVCNIGVAWNRRVKKGDQWEDEPVFINGAIWGARGAAFARNFKKGDPVFLVGELKLNEWTDKENRKRQDIVLHVNEWQFPPGGLKDRGDQPQGASASDTDDTPF